MSSALILTGLLALSVTASIEISPVLASVVTDYLRLDNTVFDLSEDGLSAEITAGEEIPEGDDAVGYSFGYGLFTGEGTDAIIVTTTHSGFLDSVAQNGDANSPIWHNHFVKLGPVSECEGISANSTGVIEITFDEPGTVEIDNEVANLTRVPRGIVNGTEALTDTFPFEIHPGNDVKNAMSFDLVPVFEGENLRAVCVNDINTFTADNITGGNMTMPSSNSPPSDGGGDEDGDDDGSDGTGEGDDNDDGNDEGGNN